MFRKVQEGSEKGLGIQLHCMKTTKKYYFVRVRMAGEPELIPKTYLCRKKSLTLDHLLKKMYRSVKKYEIEIHPAF
jgi:hypothetical protein